MNVRCAWLWDEPRHVTVSRACRSFLSHLGFSHTPTVTEPTAQVTCFCRYSASAQAVTVEDAMLENSGLGWEPFLACREFVGVPRRVPNLTGRDSPYRQGNFPLRNVPMFYTCPYWKRQNFGPNTNIGLSTTRDPIIASVKRYPGGVSFNGTGLRYWV